MLHSRGIACLSVLCSAACCLSMAAKSPVRVSAAALPVDGRLMTYQETVECFGTTIPVRYLDRSGVYHDETASIVSNNAPFTIGQTSYIDDVSYLVPTRQLVLYSFQTEYSIPLNQTPQQVTVQLQPEYSIFDTEYIYSAIGIEIYGTDTNLQAYNSPVWRWVFAGQVVNFDAVNTAVDNVLPNFYIKNSGGYFLATAAGNIKFNFVPAYMTSQAITSGYSTEATFDHVNGDSSGGRQTVYIAICLPYVSNGATGATGTIGTTTSITSAAPSVDLGETNGLLGSIGNLISSVVQKVTGIFDTLTETDIDTSAPDAIVTVPPDIDYDDALDNADAILDDVPDTVAASGFWWALYSKLFVQDVNGDKNPALIIATIIPLAVLLGLMSHVLWKK